VSYREDDLLLVDYYCTTPNSPKSSGTTTIWLKEAPVWTMQYGGEYEQIAIPFLKQVLWDAYAAGCFFGGSGPQVRFRSNLLYVNRYDGPFFQDFRGREEIFRIHNNVKARVLGYHEYLGMALVQDPSTI